MEFNSNKRVIKGREMLARYLPTTARTFICLYFLNVGISDFEYYYSFNVPGFPFMALPTLICTLAVLANWKVHIFGSILSFVACKDAVAISYAQFAKWWFYSNPLYINELMVKKFSILGCILLVLWNDPFFKQQFGNTTKAFVGLIMSEGNKEKTTKKASAVLLAARLLISSLFLFVGYGEIKRQLEFSAGAFQHQGHVHQRPTGDGHDSMWPKLFEFTLSLPFIVGFQTKNVARLLAAALLFEAVFYWQFWSPAEGLPFWYSIHARDHFSVNVGVAGGLLLLQSYGAGRYSVDALLKKKD